MWQICPPPRPRCRSAGRRPSDAETLKAAGAVAVYTPKDYDLTAIIADIVEIVDRETQEAA